MKLRVRTLTASLVLTMAAGLVASALAQPDIVGLYRFLEDQPADISAAEGAEILLDVAEQGTMDVTASMPGDVLTTRGTYTLNGNLISLDFPELGKSADNKPWSLQADTLILPLQFIGDGEGTSKWERVPTGDTPIECFFGGVNRELDAGKPPAEAVKAGAEEAKRRSEESGETDAETIVEYEIWDDGAGCSFKFGNGHEEDALVISRQPNDAQPHVFRVGAWAMDPRTHIPAKPHTAPDDPDNKTAVIFAPFDNAPYWAVGPGGLGRVTSFSERGENIELIRSKLESCHYTVELYRDMDATPKALYEACQRLQPGVLYISSHGGSDMNHVQIGTGVYLGCQANAKEVMNGSDRLRQLLAETMPPGFPPYFDVGMETSYGGIETDIIVPLWYQRSRSALVAVLNINDRFFRKMVDEGVDFGTSLLYISSCFSAANPALVRACQPRAFIGYKTVVTNIGSASLAHYFFRCMTRPTWSAREVLGLAGLVVDRRQCIFFPDDKLLASPALPDDMASLQYYGADGEVCELPDVDVIYLCWLARWNAKEPEKGAEALQHAYDEYWSKGSFSRLKSPFANAGVRGTHMPTAEEVEEARHLVAGNPSMTYGRFTLNDTEPTRAQPETAE